MNNKSKSYLLFSIGPVQEFIAASRKTLDLFAGSLLLSHIIGKAIGVIIDNNGEMIFPDIKSKAELVLGNIASLPNRFFCKIPNNPQKIAEDAASKVLEIFTNISSEVKKSFRINSDTVWNNFWEEQPKNFLEIYWVLLEDDDSKSHSVKYKTIEQFLGKRKLIRNFNQLEQPGIKCSLILNFSAVHTNGRDAKEFWEDHANRNKKYFRSGERLSSIAVTKRKFLTAFNKNDSFPSTSTIAVSGFIRSLIKQAMTDFDLKKSIGDYASQVQTMQKKLSDWGEIQNLPSLYKLVGENELLKRLLTIDGDWLFPESYKEKKIRKEYAIEGEIPEEVATAKDARHNLFSKIKEYNKKQLDRKNIITSPSKYYAVFYFDGDRMGEILSRAEDEDAHRDISKALRTFSTETIPRIVEGIFKEKARLGKVIYSGGDDALCFCTLDDMFNIILDIRKSFGQAMKSAGVENATGSIGVAIAHHQMNLQQVLEAARKAEHYAKEKVGRDAVGFALLKNSGEHSIIGAKWFPNGNSIIDVLKSFSKKIDDKILSTSFIHDLEDERIGLEKNISIPGMIESEIKRLLKRRTSSKAEKEQREKNEGHPEAERDWKKEIVTFYSSLKTSRLNEENKLDVSVLKQFIDLLEIAQFTARGGVK
jgi:CRISPR-associated protein Cmr2